jgi:hypothetical protein
MIRANGFLLLVVGSDIIAFTVKITMESVCHVRVCLHYLSQMNDPGQKGFDDDV